MIQRDRATIKAKERIIATIIERFPAELVKLQADLGQDLSLNAPSPEACFDVGRRIDMAFLSQYPVVFIIEQTRPAVVLEDLTLNHGMDGAEVEKVRCQHVDLPLRVRFVFSERADYYAFGRNGRKVTREEWMQYASEVYRGALINTIGRFAVEGEVLQDVVVESDMAFQDVLTEQSDSMMLGGVILDLVCRQECSVPFHRWSNV